MKTIRYFLYLLLGVAGFVMFCFLLVEFGSNKRIFRSVNHVPQNQVGLVLGTSQYLRNGQVNLYFKYRIEATVLLFKEGKIKYILVSGDNRIVNYNEPERMRRELVKHGIPNENIILDYAGFRTLDSVVRSKKVFGQNSITIISQKFHNKRALYIASHYQMNAIAFNAKGVSLRSGLKTSIREVFARVKMILDLYVLQKEPHFLGDPISIPQ